MALGVEAQPNLNTRFAKQLLARTSVVVDPLDSSCTGSWVTNGAGYMFNPNYGFGLIDADAFTREAVRYSGVTPLVTEVIDSQIVNETIPDADFIYETFILTGQDPLEEIEIQLDFDHTWGVNQLEAYLRSPSGMMSRLMTSAVLFNVDYDDTIDWTFTSNGFWGEIPAGEWQLYVGDVFEADGYDGTWNNYSVRARMGTLVPEPSSLSMLSIAGMALAIAGRVSPRRGR